MIDLLAHAAEVVAVVAVCLGYWAVTQGRREREREMWRREMRAKKPRR